MTYQPKITSPKMLTDRQYRAQANAALGDIPEGHRGEAVRSYMAVEKAFDRQREWKATHAVNVPARIDALREKRLSDSDPDLDIEHVERVAWGMGR